MPAKSKGVAKANNAEPKSTTPQPQDSVPTTIDERSRQLYLETNPLRNKVEEGGFSNLTPVEKKTYVHTNLVVPVSQQRISLSAKTEREFWKQVTKEGLPIRRLRKDHSWGKDKSGQDIGAYKIDDFEKRSVKQAQLAALNLLHHHFLTKRRVAQAKDTAILSSDIEEEKVRRKEMAALRKDLYGQITGSLASEPEWDDVIPIPNDEPEDSLAKIAYPDDYAEAVSYLRAVMAAEEYSPRCLRLTDLVIDMNPSHYTVWLYRFKIISTLQLPVPDEITWLNQVALENLKNYQIWHHRQLLVDYYYPDLSAKAEQEPAILTNFANSERQFIETMLQEDSKNYHVWSYRQALVRKLNIFNITELAATQNLIEADVRNNSAWSHRFFLMFSNPAHATADLSPTEHDPKIPVDLITKESKYAEEKILLAPQNQSPWNYLRGVLAKGGCKLSTVQGFAEQFITNLGEDGETVRSSHALDLLADIHQETGDHVAAKLCLQRLWEKWDPVREGYWKYRATQLG